MTQMQEEIPRAYVLSIWAAVKAGHAEEWANTQHIFMPGTLMFQTQWIYTKFLLTSTSTYTEGKDPQGETLDRTPLEYSP